MSEFLLDVRACDERWIYPHIERHLDAYCSRETGRPLGKKSAAGGREGVVEVVDRHPLHHHLLTGAGNILTPVITLADHIWRTALCANHFTALLVIDVKRDKSVTYRLRIVLSAAEHVGKLPKILIRHPIEIKKLLELHAELSETKVAVCIHRLVVDVVHLEGADLAVEIGGLLGPFNLFLAGLILAEIFLTPLLHLSDLLGGRTSRSERLFSESLRNVSMRTFVAKQSVQ